LLALQDPQSEFRRLGAELVAISPQTPDESLSTAEKNELAIAVLSDIGSATAKAYGIAFDLAEELRPIYARFQHALPDKTGDDRPGPAHPLNLCHRHERCHHARLHRC
jgi:AhpC/TSA family